MKILIIGLGSIGRRHLGNIKTLQPQARVAVWRQLHQGLEEDIKGSVDELFLDEKAALAWGPDIVFVTNPAPFHIRAALTFARTGCHLFIEKPLSDSLDGISRLDEICRQRGMVIMVGYVLRFLKPLQIMKQAVEDGKIGKILSLRAQVGRYLPAWRPGNDYRQNVTAQKKLGGGVLLELSHEIDYIRWLGGEVESVSTMVGQVADFDIDVEDLAEISFRLKSGALAQVHLDMIDRAAQRSCRIIGSEGTLCWDAQPGHSVKQFSAADMEGKVLWHQESYDHNEMFLEELRHFFQCVQAKQPASISLFDGRKVVEIVLAARKSAQSGKEVRL